MKIAILTEYLSSWNGGLDFLMRQIKSLELISKESDLEISVFIPRKKCKPFKKLALRIIIKIRKILRINSDALERKLNNLIKENKKYEPLKKVLSEEMVCFYKKRGLGEALQNKKIDVSFFADEEINQIPNVFYYPDFQHKHLLDLFSQKEILDRDLAINDTFSKNRVVVLNSAYSKKDLKEFFPHLIDKCTVLHLEHAPILTDKTWLDDLEKTSGTNVNKKYNLPEKFFLISNQFWVHKSHLTAFKALSLLQKNPDFSDLHIVCTGECEDYRFPGYFQTLREKTKELGVENKIIYLGLIEKREQIEIMKGAIAVIQPTLFEGDPGGGCCYDSMAIGARSIISDIDVNLEISETDDISFFKAEDEKDLSEKMEFFYRKNKPQLSKENLILESNFRAKKRGLALLKAAKTAISSQENTKNNFR